VVRSDFCKGLNLSWKRAKKEPKGETQIVGPASVIWDQFGPKRGNLATLLGKPDCPSLATRKIKSLHMAVFQARRF